MLLHNLKQIIRGLWRYKSFTFINFLGLSIGIAAIVLLYLIAIHERSFDHLHSDNNKIYRVVSEQPKAGKIESRATVPYPTAKFFRNEYAGALATEVHFDRERSIKIGDRPAFREPNLVFADSLFFKVMDFGQIKNFWIKGDPKALEAPNKAILTESTAKRYFGNEDPIGKLIKLDNKVDIEVAGLIKDIPATTHLPVNAFISFSTLNNKKLMAGLDVNYWGFRSNGYCYVKIDDQAKPGVINALNAVIQKNARNDIEKKEKLLLQPISAIHFDPTYEESNANYTVSDKYLRILLLLGAFITLIACVNYINLSTSLAFSKSKEVGIRKTIGASRSQLFFHYLMETVIVTVIAAIIGLVVASAVLPTINQWLEKSISIKNLLNVQFFITAFLFIIIISIISGAYPALILSRFNPIATLKNQLAMPGKTSVLLRKGLVIFQFTTSIVLIICTIVIATQVKYFTTKSLGFNKDAVVEVALPESDSARRESFKAQLQNQAGIKDLSFCLGAPVSQNDVNTEMKAPELPANVEYSIKIMPCDGDFLKVYDLQLLAGRWLLPGEIKSEGIAIVVNETTVKTLGYKNPSDAIGKKVEIGINDYTPLIVGVTKDFHTTSLHQAITPVALMPFRVWFYAAAVRIDPLNMKQSLAKIESAWRKVYPNDVYQVKFIDEALAERYKQEQKDYTLFRAFSAISVFICCIGLWGLIAFVVVRKTKEIGIRKVLGATVSGIVALLSKDFLKLVLISLAVASPIAWYFMNKWLENFAYRIGIHWWVFALAGSIIVVIALFTISFQAIKAALSNPVKNLRTE